MGKPTQTVNVAVLGAGAIGSDHLAGFAQHPAARVVALAESHAGRRAEAEKKFGLACTAADYREILARDDVDVVTVALPTHLHAPVALAALRAGKHVYLEKPMAVNAREAAAIAAAAKRARRVLMIGQNFRFGPAAQTLKRLARDGALGEIYAVRAYWQRRGGIPRIGSWYTRKGLAGGGVLNDTGPHMIDLALHLLGRFDVTAVSAQTSAHFGPRGLGNGGWGKSEIDPRAPFDVEDCAIALLRLRGGAVVQLHLSWAAHQDVDDAMGVQLYGTEAGACVSPLAGLGQAPLWVARRGPRGPVVEHPEFAPLVPVNRYAHFVDLVLGRAESFVPVAQSVAVQKVIDAIYRSAAQGREVKIP